MKSIYSKKWIKKRKKYGFSQYEKKLCQYIINTINDSISNAKILEVAIGTGETIVSFLSNRNYEVHGINFSPSLIQICQSNNPKIKCKICNGENIQYSDGHFDLVYCINSTWYF